MKLIIAGGRDYFLTREDYGSLDELLTNGIEHVSGGCAGADICGEKWAKRNGLKTKIFKAEWAAYGRSAGPLRNQLMADYADALAIFPGGKGTQDMHNKALGNNLIIYDFRDRIGREFIRANNKAMSSAHQKMIVRLLDCDTVTKLEYDFINIIAKQRSLTDDQMELLTKVYYQKIGEST